MKSLALIAGSLASILVAGCGVGGPSPRTSGTLEVRVSVTKAPRMSNVSPSPQPATGYLVTISRKLESETPFTVTAKTDESGTVHFKPLEPGTYEIKVDSPNAVTVVRPLTGPSSATVRAGEITSVSEAVSASCPSCQ